jgi:hypothetical protein
MTLKHYGPLFCAALVMLALGCGEDGGGEMPPSMMTDMGAGDTQVTSDGGTMLSDAEVVPSCESDDDCESSEYCFEGEAGVNRCRSGCREGGCEAGRLCDLELHICVRDIACGTDEDCFFGEYCEAGLCTDGCRLDDAEACPRNEEGLPTACDPETRGCTVQVVCCDAETVCSYAFETDCSDIVEGERVCSGNTNPCLGRCTQDTDCDNADYCDSDTGRCAAGCREDGRGCTEGRVCNLESRLCVRPTCSEDGDCEADYFCAIDVCLEGCRYTYGAEGTVVDPRGNCANPTFICDTRHTCSEPDTSCFSDEACELSLNQLGAYCEQGVCKSPCLVNEDCDCVATEEVACSEQDIVDGLANTCAGSRCEPGCRDDSAEPNDSIETATALSFDEEFNSGVKGPFEACDGPLGGNSDFFSFVVPNEDMTIKVFANFTHASGDVDIFLYRPDGSRVEAPLVQGLNFDPDFPKCDKQGTSCSDDEFIDYPSTGSRSNPGGVWVIKARAIGIDKNQYNLRVELSTGSGPDAAEVDDLPSLSTTLDVPGMTDNTTVNFRTIHAGDQDWFSVDLGQKDGFAAELEILGNDAGSRENLELQLYQAASTNELNSDECWDGAQPIEGLCASFLSASPINEDLASGPLSVGISIPNFNTLINDGVYYLRVVGLTDVDMSRYRFKFEVTRYYPLCFEDSNEVNDSQQTAYDIMGDPALTRVGFNGEVELRPGDQRLTNLSLCGGDVDWFQFDIAEGDVVDARIERQESMVMGDTTIELHDAAGNLMPVPVGTNQNAVNSVRLPENAAAGTYFVKVQTNETTIPVRTNYQLVLNRIPGAVQCNGDQYEVPTDNNIAGRAELLGPGVYQNLSLCGADLDADWFMFELSDETTIDVSIDFDHRQGNLDLLIYYEPPIDENGEIRLEVPPENSFQGRIDNVAAQSDGERVVLENSIPGTYYVKVKGTNRPTVAYDLSLVLTERVYQCTPMEETEMLQNGENLSTTAPQSLADEYLCYRPFPGDGSSYQMLVPGNGSRTISTHINPDRGKLYINLLDVDTMMVATTQEFVTTESGTHCIELDNLGDSLGLYYIQVLPWSISTANERLDFELNIGDTDNCLDVTPVYDVPYSAFTRHQR